MRVRDDEDEIEFSYCRKGYRTDHNIGRSHGTVAARGQPVYDFDIADSESDTHPNLDQIPRLLSTLCDPHTHIHSLN